MSTVKVIIIPERETKNTWRYQLEPTQADGIIDTLYLNKEYLGKTKRPDKITVTFEWEES